MAQALFRSTKKIDGFSVVFRQWRADSHCQYLHGYAIEILFTFEGYLDQRSWVWDFGALKRAKHLIDGMQADQWLKYMFDHTTIISADDPQINLFKDLEQANCLQLRILPSVSLERFAEFIFSKFSTFVKQETENRVKLVQVEVIENHKNSAIYIPCDV